MSWSATINYGPQIGLRAKYLLLACSIAAISALAVSAANFVWVEHLAVERSIEDLETRSREIAIQIEAGLFDLRNQTLTISRVPPFEGLARALRNGGVDPSDGSTVEQWRDRLETVFLSVMDDRPAYDQIRFIGVADGGRELVRVNRLAFDVLEPTAVEDLQQKVGEPYFRDGLTLSAGEVYFSDITLNRDFGGIETDKPMLRAVTPVLDANDEIFGLFVINVHFDQMIHHILRRIDRSPDLYIFNDRGDFVHRAASGRIEPVVLRGALRSPPAVSVEAVLEVGFSGSGTRSTQRGDHVIAASQIRPDVKNASVMVVALSAAREALLADVDQTRRNALFLALGMIAAMSVLALVASRSITAPLHSITTALRSHDPAAGEVDLPIGRRDEIGDLAQAFNTLIGRQNRLRDRQAAVLARLQSILDNTVDGMITTDARGTVTDFNKAAERIFGYRAEDVVGQDVSMLMPARSGDPGDENFTSSTWAGMRAPGGGVHEATGRTRTGRTIALELSVSEIRLPEGTVYSGIIREISERKRLEKQVQDHAEALKRSNTDLEEFAYIASHDLKEPIRAISNHCQFLAEDHGPTLGEDGNKRIDRLKELCQRSDRLINDLLQFSRLNLEEMRTDEIDMGQMATEIRAGLADYLTEHHASVEIVTPLPPVRGDRTRLSSLVYNLVVNGIKYNDRDDKRIEIGFDDGVTGGGAFYVRDNGIGIKPEFRDSVFKIFKRLNSEKAYGAGSGVGLSFARKIVERHGGRLWFESTPGAGTTFFFRIPRRPE